MNIFQNFSIKQKLIFINLITIIPILTLVTLLYIKVDTDWLKTEFISNLQSVAKLTANYTAPDLMFLDQDGGHETLANLKEIPNVKGAICFDKNNQRFSSYGIILDSIRAKSDAEIVLYDNFIIINEPITFKGQFIGSLALFVSTEEIESSIHTRIIELVLYLGLAALCVILLSTIFQNFISNPIKHLGSFIDESIELDNYTERIDIEQKNEIGKLYTGVNSLLDKVEQNTISQKLTIKFLELTNENVIVINKLEAITFVSSSFSKLIQYNSKDLINAEISKITNDSSFFTKMMHHFESDSYIEFNSTLILKNHTLLPIHIKAFLLDEDNSQQYICLIEKI